MGAMASQITSLAIVYSTDYSGADQRKHQSSASLAFVRGIHRWPVNSPHKWPVTRKMMSSWIIFHQVLQYYLYHPYRQTYATNRQMNLLDKIILMLSNEKATGASTAILYNKAKMTSIFLIILCQIKVVLTQFSGICFDILTYLTPGVSKYVQMC